MRVTDNIVVDNARIGFRNFSGKEGQYNQAGNRNFVLFLDDSEFASKLESEGWNIRWLKPRDEQDKPQPMLQVAVGFGAYPPKIVLISNNKKSILDIIKAYALFDEPYTILIDKDGTIIDRNIPNTELDAKLNKLLK